MPCCTLSEVQQARRAEEGVNDLLFRVANTDLPYLLTAIYIILSHADSPPADADIRAGSLEYLSLPRTKPAKPPYLF